MSSHRHPAISLIAVAAIATAALSAACDADNGGDAGGPSPVAPAAGHPLTLRGALTLDGRPLEAEFLGARVLSDGLTGACQLEIPRVTQGGYEIDVASDAQVRGCGQPGADVLLWTFVADRYLFSTETAPWSDESSVVAFDGEFSSEAPDGASEPVTEFKGHLFAADGSALPAGTVVEAFADDVRCGVTSLRPPEATEGFYTLIVAGPESISGCASDATLAFRLDGEPAAETAINDLGSGGRGHELDLTQR
jgi:hypothetical protein